PKPTVASFTLAGAYSAITAPAAPAAASTAPRASPRRNALCTLRATKARSRTTAAGSHAAIRRRHSACRRARRAPRSPAGASTIVPLARWRKPPPRASTTPQPVSRLPGSIPSTRTPTPPPAPAVGSRRQPLQLLRRDVHVRRHALHVVVVLVHAGTLDRDEAALVEHPGDGARRRQVAAVLGDDAAHVGHGAVAVVGEHLDEDRDATRPVGLVGDLLVGDALELARALLDGALDVVGRHAVLARRGDRGAQPRVRVDVAAAQARRDRDLLDELGEELAAPRVLERLLVLD